MRLEHGAATSPVVCDGAAARPPAVPRRAGPWLQVASLRGFEWNRLDVPIANLPPVLHGLRILHLTDTHLRRRWPAALDEVIGRLSADPPDLILFTGDFVDDKFDHRHALPLLQRLARSLPSRLGFFAVTGNHDGDLLGPRLGSWGVQLLNRRYLRLESHDAALELIGLPGVARGRFDPHFLASIPQRRAGVPRIVVGHFPDQVLQIAPLQADLMLAGHTHGGQVCLPGDKALVTHDSLDKCMARGVHHVNDTMLVVNRGMGFAWWPVRLFCPAEVIELRITKMQPQINADERR